MNKERKSQLGKGLKGQKGQKRRHWGDASRFYWPRRQKGRGRFWVKLYQDKPLLNQCLRPYFAVAFVPLVPSVPLIVPGRSLIVRRTLNFKKLSPAKRKPFAAGKGTEGTKGTEATPLGGRFALLLAPETKGTRQEWGGASTMPSLKSLGIAWWQDWAKQSLGQSLDRQCFRPNLAVAKVP